MAMMFRRDQNQSRGFALLVAVIFMSVMLAFGLALGSLAYKQTVLASSAVDSHNAFYAADAALECALSADQQSPVGSNPFDKGGTLKCDTQNISISIDNSHSPGYSVATVKDMNIESFCADVTVYKFSSPVNNYRTFIFAQGYSVSCSQRDSNPRYASRGLQAHY